MTYSPYSLFKILNRSTALVLILASSIPAFGMDFDDNDRKRSTSSTSTAQGESKDEQTLGNKSYQEGARLLQQYRNEHKKEYVTPEHYPEECKQRFRVSMHHYEQLVDSKGTQATSKDYLDLGKAYYNSARYYKALVAYWRSYELPGAKTELLCVKMAECYYQLGQYALAVHYYANFKLNELSKARLKESKEQPLTRQNSGSISFTSAVQHKLQALKTWGDHSYFQGATALQNARKGNNSAFTMPHQYPDECKKLFSQSASQHLQLVELKGKAAEAEDYLDLGRACYNSAQYYDALVAFMIGKRLPKAKSAKFSFKIAECFYQLGNYSLAVHYYSNLKLDELSKARLEESMAKANSGSTSFIDHSPAEGKEKEKTLSQSSHSNKGPIKEEEKADKKEKNKNIVWPTPPQLTHEDFTTDIVFGEMPWQFNFQEWEMVADTKGGGNLGALIQDVSEKEKAIDLREYADVFTPTHPTLQRIPTKEENEKELNPAKRLPQNPFVFLTMHDPDKYGGELAVCYYLYKADGTQRLEAPIFFVCKGPAQPSVPSQPETTAVKVPETITTTNVIPSPTLQSQPQPQPQPQPQLKAAQKGDVSTTNRMSANGMSAQTAHLTELFTLLQDDPRYGNVTPQEKATIIGWAVELANSGQFFETEVELLQKAYDDVFQQGSWNES